LAIYPAIAAAVPCNEANLKRRGKILVDDDPIVLEITRDRLQRAGYFVITRDQALGTSTAISQEEPDVVLLDVSMPGLSGEALARIIGQNPRHERTAIIFHSGGEPADLQTLVARTGAVGSIQKTSDASLFRLQFDRLLALWRARTGYAPDEPPSTPRKG
jgi:CheY-like chemotaxis protein